MSEPDKTGKLRQHEADPRTVVLDNVRQFASLTRNFRGAALCPYDPFTDEQNKEIEAFMESSIDNMKTEYNNADIDAARKDGSIPQAVLDTIDDMTELFEAVAGQKAKSRYIRLNSHLKSGFHTHDTSLTYTFTEGGTLARSEKGVEYAAPKRNIFILDSSIEHDSSKVGTMFDPKMTLLIF